MLDGELRVEYGAPGRPERDRESGGANDGSAAGGQSITAAAGEFFHVRAGTVHCDVNPSSDEQDYGLWLTGSEPRTVPVDGPPER